MENYCVVNSQNPDTRCTSNSLNQDRKDFDAHLKSDQVAIAEQKLTSQIERYLGSNDSKIEKLSQCEEEPFLRITEQVAILQPHCKISLEAFFPNNISDLNAAVKSKIITAIRADACYRSKVAMKGDELDLISKIEI